MNPAIVIRNETDTDFSAITEVTVAAEEFKANGLEAHAGDADAPCP